MLETIDSELKNNHDFVRVMHNEMLSVILFQFYNTNYKYNN